MPRYLVERTFPQRLVVPIDDRGAAACGAIIAKNLEQGVTWVHSYVSEDCKQTFCIYDAPSPEAIRKVSRQNELPVERITEVRVLDPYFYR